MRGRVRGRIIGRRVDRKGEVAGADCAGARRAAGGSLAGFFSADYAVVGEKMGANILKYIKN